jgi:hypothetical protein
VPSARISPVTSVTTGVSPTISGGGLANTPSESTAANDAVEDHMVIPTVSIASKRLQKKKLNK